MDSHPDAEFFRIARAPCRAVGCTEPLICFRVPAVFAIEFQVQHGTNPEHAMTIDRHALVTRGTVYQPVIVVRSWLERVHQTSILETTDW